MKKNDVINVDILCHGCNAEGVAKVDGETVFVPYALYGENVDATIIKANSKFAIAKINKINRQSPQRIVAPCPYFSKCGGCQLQHTTYQNGLKIKRQIVQNAISNIAKLDVEVLDVIACQKQYHYRNKVSLPINPATKSLGMYRPMSHSIVDIEKCPLQKSQINLLVETFNQFLKLTKNTIYDERTKSGLLKSLVARNIGEKLLVTVVINGEDMKDKKLLCDMLKKSFDQFGLSLNINTMQNNVILSTKFVQVYGLNEIELQENGIAYAINNQSFLQVNDETKSALYQKVFEEVDGGVVIDAYSGAGLLSAMMAQHAQKVFGIEIVEEATNLANQLKSKNNIQNLQNINGDCAKVLPELLSRLSGDDKANLTVVLDPPRKGCARDVLSAIVNVSPKKIVYVSCEPSTLARDLNIIASSCNYNVKYIQPYDMFPQTKHVETLAVLEKF